MRHLHVDLGLRHQQRVEELKSLTGCDLPNSSTDRTHRCTHNINRLTTDGVGSPRTTKPVDSILQTTRNRAIILRSCDQNRIGIFKDLLEVSSDLRVVRIVIRAVQRQLREISLNKFQISWSIGNHRTNQLAINGVRRQRTNDVSDLVSHRKSLSSRSRFRAALQAKTPPGFRFIPT